MNKMYTGMKEEVSAKLLRRGVGEYIASSAERRIVDSCFRTVVGCDWAACNWDPVGEKISTLFDSTMSGLSGIGSYWVEFRLVIGEERIGTKVLVQVREWEP